MTETPTPNETPKSVRLTVEEAGERFGCITIMDALALGNPHIKAIFNYMRENTVTYKTTTAIAKAVSISNNQALHTLQVLRKHRFVDMIRVSRYAMWKYISATQRESRRKANHAKPRPEQQAKQSGHTLSQHIAHRHQQ